MRVTVLCILALVGATCALQIPPRASRQSILGIPLPNLGGSDSSSSSSSSEEDPSTLDLANDLAQRLVDDFLKVAESAPSSLLFPINVGTTLMDTLIKDVKDWLGNILRPENSPIDGDVVALSADLAQSIIKDSREIVQNIATGLLEPVKLKARLVKIVLHNVTQWLKKVLPNGGRRPGQSSPPPSQPPHDKPPHGHRPKPPHGHRPKPPHGHRPTPPHGHRPTPPPEHKPSSSKPKPTPSNKPSSSTEKSVNSRIERDIQISISGDIDLDKLKNALANVDFSKVTKEIPKIPDLPKITELPLLPGLAQATKEARKLLINALGVAATTVPEAIQKALNLAIKSADPACAIVEVVGIIAKSYLGVAQSAITLAPVGLALIREATIVVGSAVSTVLSVLSTSVAAGVQALI